MTDRFTLAAQVLLTRRLKNLLRVDEITEIDQSYITSAEYQLFIDAQRVVGKRVQPTHWMTERFAPGNAKSPITGITPNDAVAFCDWLTEQQSIPGVRYRLPTPSEASEHMIGESLLGYWCQSDQNFTVSEINQRQMQTYRKQLYGRLERDFTHARTHGRDHKYDDLNFDSALAFGYDSPLNLERACNSAFDLAQALTRARSLDLDPALARELVSARDLASDLALDLDRARARYLYLDIAHELASVPRYQTISVYLVDVFVLWKLLYKMYKQASKKSDRSFRISRYNERAQECVANWNKVSQLYCLLSLINLRREGKIPAWESLRIVRERSDD